MLGVTFFGLLLTPVFFVLIRRSIERNSARNAARINPTHSLNSEAH
jgi:multidrug efflux pump